jgi:hypothetical protein
VIETCGARYRVSRDVAPAPPGPAWHPRRDPARVLNIISLGASAEGSDIAHLKDRYVADAVAHRGR